MPQSEKDYFSPFESKSTLTTTVLLLTLGQLTEIVRRDEKSRRMRTNERDHEREREKARQIMRV